MPTDYISSIDTEMLAIETPISAIRTSEIEKIKHETCQQLVELLFSNNCWPHGEGQNVL